MNKRYEIKTDTRPSGTKFNVLKYGKVVKSFDSMAEAYDYAQAAVENDAWLAANRD